MPSTLYAFDDPAACRQAARRLVDAGLPAHQVRLHMQEGRPQAALLGEVDEVVTGGIVHNFASLLEGLFEWGQPAVNGRAFEETLEHGGAVVTVKIASEAERERVDAVMGTAANVKLHSGWSAS